MYSALEPRDYPISSDWVTGKDEIYVFYLL